MFQMIREQARTLAQYSATTLILSGLVLVPSATEYAKATSAINYDNVTCDLTSAGYLGNGSAQDPYQISDSESLWEIADCSTTNSAPANFILTSDIDVSEATAAPTHSPIGVNVTWGGKRFQGTLNGNGKSITNISISSATGFANPTTVGLFWELYEANVFDLTISGQVSFTGNSNSMWGVGGLAGLASITTISGVTSQVNVRGYDNVGGLVGYSPGVTKILNSKNLGSVSGVIAVGGLIGYQPDPLISSSSNHGTISATTREAGGLVGKTNSGGEISFSENTGAVSAPLHAGGLVGSASEIEIRDSFTKTGMISGSQAVGGLIGTVNDTFIANSENRDSVVSGSTKVGGLVGFVGGNAAFHETTNSGEVFGGSSVGGYVGEVDGLSADFIGTEVVNRGIVEGQNGIGGFVGSASATVHLNQALNDPQFSLPRVVPGAIYGQQNTGGFVGSGNRVEIGYSSNKSPVSGTDGVGGLVGRAVTAVFTESSNVGEIFGNDHVGGLIGYGSTISIVTSSNSGDITGMRSAGGLVGYGADSIIRGSANQGQIYGENWIGGLIGYADLADVANSTNSGPVEAEYFASGGILGSLTNGVIASSRNTGFIDGSSQSGGLVGQAGTSITIYDSVNQGAVSGTEDVGGLVGKSFLIGIISNSSNVAMVQGTSALGGLVGNGGTLRIHQSSNRGLVDGQQLEVGGLVGTGGNISISASFNEDEVSGGAFIGGLVGSTLRVDISDSFNVGAVSGTGAYGGLVGSVNNELRIARSFNGGEVSSTGDGLVGSLAGGATSELNSVYTNVTSSLENLSTITQMRVASLYVGWDFNSTWGFGLCTEREGLPSLRFSLAVATYYSTGCYSAPAAEPTQSSGGAAYSGPTVTSGMQKVSAGETASFLGTKLDQVTSVRVGSVELEIVSKNPGSLTVRIPASTSAGQFDLELISSYGKVTVLGSLTVTTTTAPVNPIPITQSPTAAATVSALIGKTFMLPGRLPGNFKSKELPALSARQKGFINSRLEGTGLRRIVCSALVAEGATKHQRVQVRKLAKVTCQEVKRYLPDASAWVQVRETKKVSLSRRVAMTIRG